MVPAPGLEPGRPEGQGILSPLRLPVPPRPPSGLSNPSHRLPRNLDSPTVSEQRQKLLHGNPEIADDPRQGAAFDGAGSLALMQVSTEPGSAPGAVG